MTKRQHYIDWIRVIAFAILIFYHSGMFFVSWGWHVKNNVISEGFEVWMELINPWRLSLLFFVSGVGVSFAMKSRTGLGFLTERSKRLLLPLAFGMLVVVPPQIYYERLQTHAFEGSYAAFYPSVFDLVPYPAGSFSWHHLWFVAYLWVFSLIAIPIFLWLRRHPIQLFEAPKASINFLRIMLFVLPLAATYWLLKQRWEVTHNLTSDWYNFVLSFLFFVYGYLFGSQSLVWDLIETHRKTFLSIGVFLILFSKGYDAIFGAIPEDSVVILVFNGLFKMTFVWCIILAICTITVMIGFYIADWSIAVIPKFLILVAGTFGVSFLIYHFIIRPFGMMRVLFGVK